MVALTRNAAKKEKLKALLAQAAPPIPQSHGSHSSTPSSQLSQIFSDKDSARSKSSHSSVSSQHSSPLSLSCHDVAVVTELDRMTFEQLLDFFEFSGRITRENGAFRLINIPDDMSPAAVATRKQAFIDQDSAIFIDHWHEDATATDSDSDSASSWDYLEHPMNKVSHDECAAAEGLSECGRSIAWPMDRFR